MRRLKYDEVNRHINSNISDKKLPFGWTGTVLDLLDYSSIPLDSRVNATICLLDEYPWVLEGFSAWCWQELEGIKNNDYASKALEIAAFGANHNNMGLLASYMRRAFYEDRLAQTNNVSMALSASIGTAGAQALTLYRLLKEEVKENN